MAEVTSVDTDYTRTQQSEPKKRPDTSAAAQSARRQAIPKQPAAEVPKPGKVAREERSEVPQAKAPDPAMKKRAAPPQEQPPQVTKPIVIPEASTKKSTGGKRKAVMAIATVAGLFWLFSGTEKNVNKNEPAAPPQQVKHADKQVSPVTRAVNAPAPPAEKSDMPKVETTEPVKTAQPEPEAASPKLQLVDVLQQIPVKDAQEILLAMMNAAREGDDARLRAVRRELQRIPLPSHGNRSAARLANSAALDAFRRGDFNEATEKLMNGVKADPADQELVNNLAYALYRQKRLDEAKTASVAALTLAPERTSAWSNLGEILAEDGDQDKAVLAFLLAYKFSSDQQKTHTFLQKLAQDESSFQVRNAASQTLRRIAQLPPPAPNPPAARQPQENTTQPQPNQIVLGMIEDGEACLATKKFDCAITNAKAALRVDPSNVRARTLQRIAEAEQRKAMDSITIY